MLEIGTGTGLVAVTAAKKSMKVVATDLNPHGISGNIPYIPKIMSKV